MKLKVVVHMCVWCSVRLVMTLMVVVRVCVVLGPTCDDTYGGLCVCLQLECSGHGRCECDKCYCDAQYIGPTCDDCPVSTSVLLPCSNCLFNEDLAQ